MKKRIALIFTVLLFSVLGFSACGDPYKKMSFSLTSEKDLTETVELYLGKSDAELDEYDLKDSFEIKAKVSGVGKKISTDVVVPDFNDKVDIETTKSGDSTTIKITAKSEGETMLAISPKENPDGKFTKYVRVKVGIGLTSFSFKENAISAIAMGNTLNLNVDTKKYIDFFPTDTSQTDIEYSIEYPTGNHDYAEIKNGVLYTYDSENYPMSNGRRIVTLVAKNPSRTDIVAKYDITVVKVDDSINITTTYKDDDIELDKNNNGKYEIILANADISMEGGVVDEDITNRIIHIGFGQENNSTSKYRVSLVGEYSLSAGTSVTVSKYDILNSETFDYIIKSNRLTNGTDITFKVEYFGDTNDNPSSDETLYEGLFTKYITFTVKVYNLPSVSDLVINGKADDEQKYIVYDKYFKSTESNINENGTLVKVKLTDTTIPNIVSNISYTGDGFDPNGLIFVGGTKTADGITIANGESFYLRHRYSQDQIKEDAERRPYITISVDYSFAPSNATSEQKDRYYSGTITKKVYLDFKVGISDISLPSEQIGLEITSDEWHELCEFPEGYDAKATVDQILGQNLSLIELSYVDNKVMIRANQQFSTGEVTLAIVATNGKKSNNAHIMVYLPVLYTENNTLLVKLDEKDNTIFAVGKMTGENEYEVTGATTCYYETYSYSTYQNLILTNHSSLSLDVYSIMDEGGYLKSVLPNVDVTCEISDNNVLSWTTTKSSDGVLSGTLNTLNVTSGGAVTITFTLSGYLPQGEDKVLTPVTITHTITVWVFDATKISFSKALNTVVLSDSLGYYDKGDSKYTYDWEKLPKDAVTGNFNWEIKLKNADQISHKISIDELGGKALDELLKSLFGEDVSQDNYYVEIFDGDGLDKVNRLVEENGHYYFNILNRDILAQTQDAAGENDGFEAKITDSDFVVSITPKDDGTEQNKKIKLVDLFEKMIVNKYSQEKHNLALAYIFNGNNKTASFKDFVLSGQASQFGRGMYVETVLRVYKPVKVTSIDVSVSKDGLYFEKETGKDLVSQSFTYNVLPYDAYNNDIMLKIYTKNNVEQNIIVKTTELFTLSADGFVTIDSVKYRYEDAKLYKYNATTENYDIETDLECSLIDANTLSVVFEENTCESATTVASITMANNRITITIQNNISGDYVLKIIAKDSVTQLESGEFEYGVTKDVRVEIGDGSKVSPFQLRSIDSLIRMWNRNISGQETFCYKLNNNINVLGQNFAEYIFNSKNLFKGDFDGNGKAIIGLTATQSVVGNATGGLFAKYEPNTGNSIHDLTLSNINYNIAINTNEEYVLNVGGIAGSANGTLENVYVSGNINIDYAKEINENEESIMYVGGVVGTMSSGKLVGTAESSSFADDMTANVAMIYNGFAVSDTQGSHYFGGAIGCVSGEATIENVKVSSSIKAINNDNASSDTIAQASLGGLVGIVEGTRTIKDSRITPTLSGYVNIGGVVGESTAILDLNHVVVEFLHNANVKNYIMGLDNVGGFVGNTTAKVSLTNSYVRSFVKDEVAEEYDADKYCGNIIVRSGLDTVNAGGFIGNTSADIKIEHSYVMGDIKSYVGSDKTENIGGFVSGYDNTKTINITDAYYIGKILTNKVVPNILFGSDDTPLPTAGTSVENITTKITENTMTDDKNVGEYIKIETTKTESVSYQDYTYNCGDDITISNFYANVNSNHHVWTEKNQHAYTLRTTRNVVKSTLYMTFARMNDSSIVYTGYKVVEDSNSGTKKRYDLFETPTSDEWYKKQTTYVDTTMADTFTGLGFVGQNANVESVMGNPKKFVLNAKAFGNPSDIELVSNKTGYNVDSVIKALLCNAGAKTTVTESVNTLFGQCVYNEEILDETFEIKDISGIEIGDLYSYEYVVENERNVLICKFDNEEYAYYYTINSVTEIGKITLNEVGLELYVKDDELYIDNSCTIVFASVIIVITTEKDDDEYEISYVALGINESSAYVGTDGQTYYENDGEYYSDESCQNNVDSITVENIQFANYTICDLVYKVDDSEIFRLYNIVKNENVITFEGKEYNVVDNKVELASNSQILAKVHGFNYTNGNVEKVDDDYTTKIISDVTYVIDTDGNVVAKYIEETIKNVNGDDEIVKSFVSSDKNASWIVSDKINDGKPTLIRKLGTTEKTDSLDVLYDAVSSMNVKVTEFNYGGSSELTPYKQGYIMLDESNVILFYNSPSDKYVSQNTYVLASSDEKAEIDNIGIGGQVPVVVDFSDILLNEPFKLNSLKDYVVKSSNPNIVSVGTYSIESTTYTALNTLGTGLVTLTFTNRYDDTNRFELNVYIVAGLTGVKDTETMSTYVQKTSTYSFGFDNTLSSESDAYVMDANVGGYTIKVVSFDGDPSLTFNGVPLDKNTVDEHEFDMSNAIVIYGEKAGRISVSLTPFVNYGNNQKYTLSYLSRTISIRVEDLAKSISTGANTVSTIKPESTVQFDVEVISSKEDETITAYITDKDGNKFTYNGEDDGETYGLVDIYVLKTNTVAIENNLYKITYTVYAELNNDEYYEYYIKNNFKNPLEEMLSFKFEFVPDSWFDESEMLTEFEGKTAYYTVNIEGNDVSDISTAFFNTKVDTDSEIEENRKYKIDSNAAYLNKLAPGRVGLLRIKVSKDYNNLSYLAVRASNNRVTLRQADATTDTEQIFSHLNIANTPTDNGIKLWNMMYYTGGVVDMNYANYFYVFVMFDEKITSGSVVDLQITAYGKGDVELIPTVTVSVDVDYLPQIEITDIYGESNVDNPIGEYRRIYINASHVEDNLSWKVATVGGVYGFGSETVGEETTYGYFEETIPSSNKYPYICYKTISGYERLPYNFTLDMINSAELYIFIPSETYLGEFKFSVSGYRIINTVPTYTTGEFVLNTMLFEIEDIKIDGVTGGVLTLPVGDYTTFSTIFTLNSYAQSVYNSYDPEGENEEFTKYLYNAVENLRKSGAGQVDYDSNNHGYNGWSYVPEKGETKQMQNGSYYPSNENSNFVFFYEDFKGIGKYGVTALKISRNTLQYKLNIKLENGIYVLYAGTDEPEIYKEVTFTLQITDSSTADHPIPIYNTTDFIQMLESISEEQVSQEVSNNSDVDPTELVFGNYILLNDLTLEYWIPRSINVSSFDGNGFTITIKSWDFSSIIEDSTVSAGLFTKIGEYTVVKNLNIDISPLLSSDTTKENAGTKFENASGKAVEEVTFGIVSAENAGVLSNIKVIATDNSYGEYLNIWTQQGYSDGELCSAIISGFVVTNTGAISDCFVGLNAVDIKEDNYSYIPKTINNNTTNSSDDTKVYPFTILGGNKLSGFVHQNNGTISNSYVMGVSIKNQTQISSNSMTAGFVNQNANNGSIYSCFVSGSEYSGYGEDIDDLRATKTHIYSKGNVGGFVYENQGNIENAYSIINIVVQTVYSGGFAYTNVASGVIKNAYTTSTTSNINSHAHGMFVHTNTATIQNVYYLLLEGEMGITSTNKSDEVLKKLDPANAIVSAKPSSSKDDKNTIAFANTGSFEGFTFASGTNSYDGIWYLNVTGNNKYYPQLVNTINYNIKSVRTLTSVESSSTSGTESTESGSTAGSNLKYNYTYKGNLNIGSEQNPIVISQPAQFAQYIVANTKKVNKTDNTGESIYVFGGVEAQDDSTYAPAYVRIINNISLSKINLSNTYSCNDVSNDKITLSKVIFAGYLIGNGMTISDITLNNTSTSGNNLEDFGLFKQIGLSETQKTSYYGDIEQQSLITPVVYNIKFSYNELSDRDANKVGLLAGSIYGGNIMNVTIEGKKDVVENTVSTITGYNLVGALAGLIQGEVTLTDITIKNVRVNATRNTIDSLSDSYNDSGSYYESFVFGQNKTAYKTIEFGENDTISNLSQISYAGGVAGVIIADNLSKDDNKISNLTDMSTYTLGDYQNVGVKIHDIVVKDNVEISGDMAGGLFGYAKNTHIRSSAFLLMQGANSTDSYQRIFGRAFGGGLIGQTNGVVLERTNIYHEDQDYQNTIDTTIAQITSDGVSKNDLFLKGDVSTTESVSVAIGGMVGLSKNMIVLDSYSKVNVYNPKSKIAGGMIGYAEGKNGVWYSFTYGNVKAKEVIGGLIGFYRYNSFDLYLNNAFALNVWSSDVQNTLKTNLTAVYGSRYDYTLRMPEIGNQMSEYLGNTDEFKLTGKTNSVVSDGNSTFTYIGSVLGKATLNNGVYNKSDENIFTIADGKLNGIAVKNLFVRGDSGDEIINDAKTAVRLFTSTKGDDNNYTIATAPVKVEKVVYNKVSTGEEDEDYKEYYTYIGDQFHNVYSSLYGVTTRTGSTTENNLKSYFDGLTPNNSDVIKSLNPSKHDGEYLTSYTKADDTVNPATPEQKVYNTDAVRYSTIFGTQYAVSQITGYFQVSGNADGVEYRNLFNDPTFTHVFNESDVKNLKDLQEKDEKGNVIKTYSDYVSATNAKATDENLSSWYFDESTGLLRYRVGSDGSVTEITSHLDLINVLESNTKGKSYVLNINGDSTGNIPSGGTTNARFSERFRGTISAKTDEEGNPILQKVYMTLSNPLFEVMEGAYLSGIEFHIDLSDVESVGASNYKDGSWGLIAQYIDNTTFENCKFIFENVKFDIISTYNIPDKTTDIDKITNTKYVGLLFGRMINSTLTGCSFEINYADSSTTTSITVNNTTSGFGAIAGMMTGGSITNMDVKIQKSINVINGGFGKPTGGVYEFKSDSTVGFEANVGGLIGVVSGVDISSVSNDVSLQVKGTVVDGDSTVGGLFGKVKGNSSISNCNYSNNMNVNVKIVSSEKSSSMSIGGVIGKLDGSTISDCYFNGSMDTDGTYTDNSGGETYNVTLTNFTQNTKLIASDYIGGIVGQISSYTNNNNVMINRVPINVTINADGGKVADDNIYVGGIFGADTNSNRDDKHSNMFVTGDITVKTAPNSGSDTHDNLYVGGVIGMSGSGVEDSYMQGDITIDGAKNNRVGGIVGAISNVVTFDKCVMYGDIRYTLNTAGTTYYLAGIVGGRIGSESNDVNEYEFKNCTVLASIYEVQYDSDNDKYDMVTDDTAGNKYSSKKYSGLNISPFIAGINVKYVILDKSDFYIIEDYFDFYYEKESKSDNPVGMYYYDVCGNLTNLAKDIKSEKLTKDYIIQEWSDEKTTCYAFANHYFFDKEYSAGTKYNPNTLTSINPNTIDGYNIVTSKIALKTNLTVNRNAVLAGNTTAGITFTGGKEVTNNGVIENIEFSWDVVMDVNNGVLNNVVAYNENKSGSDKLYGLVDTNNGYIYRSGTIVVYTGLTKSGSTIQIGGLVYTNTNTIGLSYSSSMITGLKYDKDGIAYVLDNDGNKTDTKLAITSGGIAYINSGTIADSLFNGTLYGGKQDWYNIAYINSGKIQNTYSDKNSMYYAGEQKTANNDALTADTRFHTANSDYKINFGRAYVTGGIQINTMMYKNNSTITYFATEANIYPVFNITDYNNIVGKNNTSSSNDYVLLNDLYVGYAKDVYNTQNLTGTFYGQGYSVVSSYEKTTETKAKEASSTKTVITHTKPLFAGVPNICNLNVHNFSTTANAILGSEFEGKSGSDKKILNVNIVDCKIEYKGENGNNTTQSGVAVGYLNYYNTKEVCIENTELNITDKNIIYYGIFGQVDNCNITDSTNKTSKFTISANKDAYGGGIVGCAEDSEISNTTNKSSSYSNSNFGGIIGFDKNSDITSCSLIEDSGNEITINNNYNGIVGGIVAQLEGDKVKLSDIEVYAKSLKGSAAGGVVGSAYTWFDIIGAKINITDSITGYNSAGGIISYIDTKNVTITLENIVASGCDVITTNNINNSSSAAAGGVIGRICADNIQGSIDDPKITIEIKGGKIGYTQEGTTKSYNIDSAGCAGGVVGLAYKECVTFTNGPLISVKVKINVLSDVYNKSGDTTLHIYSYSDWYDKVKYNGWIEGTRFGNIGTYSDFAKTLFAKEEELVKEEFVKEYPTLGKLYLERGYNKTNKVLKPLGFAVRHYDSNISSTGPWYGPTSIENHDIIVCGTSPSMAEQTGNSQSYKYEKRISFSWTMNIDEWFQKDSTDDDSSYYSNIPVEDIKNNRYYASSNILNGTVRSISGLVYGMVYDYTETKDYVVLTSKESKLYDKKYDATTNFLLERYVQWIYSSVERGASQDHAGIMAIEYNYCAKNNDKVGCVISTKNHGLREMWSTSNNDLSEHLDIIVGVKKYFNSKYKDLQTKSWIVGEDGLYKIKDSFKQLSTDNNFYNYKTTDGKPQGIILNFYNSMNQKSYSFYNIDDIATKVDNINYFSAYYVA